MSVNDACWENGPRAAVTSAQVSGWVGFWDVLRLRCVTWPCCSTGSTSLSWEQETKQEPGSLLILSVYMKLIIRLSIINEPMSLTPLKSDFFKGPVHPKTLKTSTVKCRSAWKWCNKRPTEAPPTAVCSQRGGAVTKPDWSVLWSRRHVASTTSTASTATI